MCVFLGIQELQLVVEEVEVPKHNFKLFKALHKVFWKEFYSVGVLRFIADLAGFAGPMLLNRYVSVVQFFLNDYTVVNCRLINFIEDKKENISWGYLYAAGLLSAALIGNY